MKSKKSISGVGVLLIFLMLCKVTAFHVYTHQDEPANPTENCAICDVAVENQNADLNLSVIDAIVSPVFCWYPSENNLEATTLLSGNAYSTRYYCRPPPTMV